jgi:O-antigen ligase/polysaccharide polymerase Wzy-like membrane protein
MPWGPAPRWNDEEQTVTTALQRTDQDGWTGPAGEPATPSGVRPRPRGSWFSDPAWPVVALLAGWPFWWAAGVGDYAPIVVAVPMLWRMYKWRVRDGRSIKLPPGFGLWLLFLVPMVVAVLTLGQTAPDTMPTRVSTASISWGMRALLYFACTVILLYAGNLTERELPRKRLAWLLGLVGMYAVAGALLAVADPSFHFTSPLAHVVPQSIQNASQGQLQALLHPGFTEKENFLGHGRVAAPFIYANTWGNNVAITLPWLFVAWRSFGSGWQRRAVWVVLFLSVVGIITSYDRGLWLAIVVAIFYLAVRFAIQGKTALLAGFVCGLLLVVIVFLLSPLSDIITNRLQNGQSDTSRTALSILSVKDALASPIIGWGDTRREFGSSKSIAIGRTANCSACGQRSAGSNGQLWLLLISTGFTGAFFYMAFFAYGIWRYRRDQTPYGITGVLVLVLSFVFSVAYNAVGGTLAFTMLAYVILWKNDRELRQPDRPPVPADKRPTQLIGGPQSIAPRTLA